MRTWVLAGSPQYGWTEGLLALRETVEGDDRPDAEIAEDLNGRTVTVPVEVPTRRVLSVMLLTGDWGRIVLASRAAPTGTDQDQLTVAAINCVAAIEHTTALGTEREEDAGVITQMMEAFVQAGLMTEQTSTRLSAMMTQEERVWDPPVSASDVAMARTLQDG